MRPATICRLLLTVKWVQRDPVSLPDWALPPKRSSTRGERHGRVRHIGAGRYRRSRRYSSVWNSRCIDTVYAGLIGQHACLGTRGRECPNAPCFTDPPRQRVPCRFRVFSAALHRGLPRVLDDSRTAGRILVSFRLRSARALASRGCSRMGYRIEPRVAIWHSEGHEALRTDRSDIGPALGHIRDPFSPLQIRRHPRPRSLRSSTL